MRYNGNTKFENESTCIFYNVTLHHATDHNLKLKLLIIIMQNISDHFLPQGDTDYRFAFLLSKFLKFSSSHHRKSKIVDTNRKLKVASQQTTLASS